MNQQADRRGSVWRRWDPHIHSPGTALANNFGDDAWDEYLKRVEQSEPRIEALGVTDYYGLDEYEVVLSHKLAGRLPDVGFIFPNVELRLPTATTNNHGINLHLLISPEDSDHVSEARRFLRSLTFSYQGESFRCDRDDLQKLGRKYDGSIEDEGAAYRAGVNQFKVSLDVLKRAFDESSWAKRNILIAVAGGSNDGTSGLRDPNASLAATRVEIERFSHIIFSANPAQRTFWLGDGPMSADELVATYGGRKACLHGSDAHTLESVGVPEQNRYTWIKGDTTFESLRQACLEPKERVVVGEEPLEGALPYRVIDSLTVDGADWFTNGTIQLASGLVAIIGARGSGKTALADLIAAAAGAASSEASEPTFLQRARRHLSGTTARLSWADGETTEADLTPGVDLDDVPDVRYLSQQFVERLCSSEGMTDELLGEIERVIFETHPYEDRLGTSSFSELLNAHAGPARAVRRRAKEEMSSLATQIEIERSMQSGFDALVQEHIRLTAELADEKAARASLVIVGGEAPANRLESINSEIAARQSSVNALRQQASTLSGLADAVTDAVTRKFPSITRTFEQDFSGAKLSQSDWDAFGLQFKGDPAEIVQGKLHAVSNAADALTGATLQKPTETADKVAPYIAENADLSTITLSVLRAEAWRLGGLIGLDENRQKQLRALNDKITKSESVLETVVAKIDRAKGSKDRVKELVAKRKVAYASLFDGFVTEQEQLERMYAPLSEVLTGQRGSLGKLTFTVRRAVDIESWVRAGEGLLDLRKAGQFHGRGELLRVVGDKLLPAWEVGGSADVANAMAAFREENDKHIVEQARVPQADIVGYRKWAADVADWLNSTDHIAVHYGVQYDGVDIERLSPGTRGIVLLLLYLAVDRTDDRPLIIDQPEENLDPKSVFDELVQRFVETRHRRQIIIVTHNANLVVNTDVDQVIVASAGAHRPGNLPMITYTSGGLENPEIRGSVCDILEGGKPAFEERARRLRISLS